MMMLTCFLSKESPKVCKDSLEKSKECTNMMMLACFLSKESPKRCKESSNNRKESSENNKESSKNSKEKKGRCLLWKTPLFQLRITLKNR